MAAMNQKSSVAQTPKSLRQALTSDKRRVTLSAWVGWTFNVKVRAFTFELMKADADFDPVAQRWSGKSERLS